MQQSTQEEAPPPARTTSAGVATPRTLSTTQAEDLLLFPFPADNSVPSHAESMRPSAVSMLPPRPQSSSDLQKPLEAMIEAMASVAPPNTDAAQVRSARCVTQLCHLSLFEYCSCQSTGGSPCIDS